MTTSDPERLNFDEPRRLSASESQVLRRWMASACERLTETWSGMLCGPIGLQGDAVEPVRYRPALASLPEPGTGIVLELGRSLFPSLLAFPRRLLLGIVAQTLGEASGDWPAARELTPLEQTTSEVLLQGFTESISDSWPGIDRLPCNFVEFCRPRRCRRLPVDSELITCRWTVTTGFGAETMVWLLPRPEIEQLLESEELSAVTEDHRTELESLVQSLPVEIGVVLGRARLSVAEVADLAAGDVLMLDQAIDRPLAVQVSGKTRWTGSPCRVGIRQAIQITAVSNGTLGGTR